MTWVDLISIALIPIYLVLGLFTGVVRRAIGFIALYVGCYAATNMGLQIAGVLTGSINGMTVPDGRIVGFFAILGAVIIIVEIASQLIHKQLEITTVALNKVLGVVIGLITAIALGFITTYELMGAAAPEGQAQLDQLQISVRDSVRNSTIAVPMTNGVGKGLLVLFKPVLPPNPSAYFGPGPVS
jgi:uncharacterized membrane protein required for colicin V production